VHPGAQSTDADRPQVAAAAAGDASAGDCRDDAVEVLAAGADALERRAQIFRLFSERTRRLHALARRQDAALPPLPDAAFDLHTGGMDELVRERLRSRGAQALPQLADPAYRATVVLFGDRTS
jgi:hypothetical protein